MLASHGPGLVVIVALVAGWVGVQTAWKRSFPTGCADPDALAGRLGCHGPACKQDCGPRHGAADREEEV